MRRKRKIFRKELVIALGFAGILVYMLLNHNKWEQQKEQAKVLQRDREIYQRVDYFQRGARWDLANGLPPTDKLGKAAKLKRQISTYGKPEYRKELEQLYNDLYRSGRLESVGGGPGSVNDFGFPKSAIDQNGKATRLPTFEESEPLENDGGGVDAVQQTARGSDVIPQPSAQLLNRLKQKSHP
ncbi:MAG: hypothetical protein WCH99_18945 [Verrucomicrobiota bacterium]